MTLHGQPDSSNALSVCVCVCVRVALVFIKPISLQPFSTWVVSIRPNEGSQSWHKTRPQRSTALPNTHSFDSLFLPPNLSANAPLVLCLQQQSNLAFSASHMLLVSLRQETTVAACTLHVSWAIPPPNSSLFSHCLSSSISSSATPSSIPELTADGVLIKSSRNRTVSKQCSTCQFSNCWALLQPLCLATEGRMRQAG